MNRRTLIAAWAALCVAGLAATTVLDDSSTPDQRTGKPARAGCEERIADIEKRMAEREREEKKSGVFSLSAVQVDPEDVCSDAIRQHFEDARGNTP
ncbi:hypothetical protein [Streptomyces fractus]|uniref:hypothetical protein n=1 Tax=Streptomyces fractus TaxID=641806 RepID=UPI003CF4A32C